MRCDRALLALVPFLVLACSDRSSSFDGGADLAIDSGLVDLAMADHLSSGDGASSGVTLQEGPCPASLGNGRCYWPPGADLGFF
jgi:hypothetical protein